MPLDPPIYLDYHATTPVDPRVHEAMMPWLTSSVGNPASTHLHGLRAAAAVDAARSSVASLVGDPAPSRVVLLGSATEACNLAIRGTVDAALPRSRSHVVLTSIEHSAVAKTCAWLRERGCGVTVVGVDSRGIVSVADVMRAIESSTVLVCVMAANNEIGTVQPVAEVCDAVATINRRRRVPVRVFSDAVQALGRVPPPPSDLVSVSGHKIYAPQGVGALVIRGDVRLAPQTVGGTQEGGLRAGTVATPMAVALGAAADLMVAEGDEEAQRVGSLRDALCERLLSGLGDDMVINGAWGGPDHAALRLPGNLNVSLPGVCPLSLGDLVRSHVSVSGGAACRSGAAETSPVIKAIGGLDATRAATVRFGLGRFTTLDEVEKVAALFIAAARRLRGIGCST